MTTNTTTISTTAERLTREDVLEILERARILIPVAPDFSGKNLSGLDLSGLDFTDGNFQDSICQGTDFRGSSFRRARCFRTDFRGSDMRYINVDEDTDFRMGNFRGTKNTDATNSLSFDKASFDKDTFIVADIRGIKTDDNEE